MHCTTGNWLLEIDGLLDEWSDGVPMSEWEGPLGDNDFEGMREEIPNAIAQLSLNLDPYNFDCSGIGLGEDEHQEIRSLLNEHDICDETQDEDCPNDRSSSFIIILLSAAVFHFKIIFEGN